MNTRPHPSEVMANVSVQDVHDLMQEVETLTVALEQSEERLKVARAEAARAKSLDEALRSVRDQNERLRESLQSGGAGGGGFGTPSEGPEVFELRRQVKQLARDLDAAALAREKLRSAHDATQKELVELKRSAAAGDSSGMASGRSMASQSTNAEWELQDLREELTESEKELREARAAVLKERQVHAETREQLHEASSLPGRSLDQSTKSYRGGGGGGSGGGTDERELRRLRDALTAAEQEISQLRDSEAEALALGDAAQGAGAATPHGVDEELDEAYDRVDMLQQQLRSVRLPPLAAAAASPAWQPPARPDERHGLHRTR